ncbi:DUF6249 domain-containing protein [Archangium lansingense]|uniref:DUF6249 domain-containing protein n=1 Tax=Archangium lansingense TaxID=2995310 RepID=A0ABT4A391_9BACT|nr:DUF6249 domain-containing protein [Archangium lansinium]MCY1076120.1 DUF6249 domain-containing protein [Archangium lansinium]
MKTLLLSACLLATLAGGRAVAAPMPEAPATPSAPHEGSTVKPQLPPRLEAQRQQMEARKSELDAQARKLAADIQQLEAEAQRIDPEGRLTRDQLFQLVQAREEARLTRAEFDPSPALISMSLFGCSLTAFIAWLVASNRKSRHLHETVRMMVEKGAEIPQGLLAPAPRRKPSDLRRGIILATSGLGLTIFLAALPDAAGAWGAGLTLLCIGVGHMIVWRLQQGRGALSAALSPELQ